MASDAPCLECGLACKSSGFRVARVARSLGGGIEGLVGFRVQGLGV